MPQSRRHAATSLNMLRTLAPADAMHIFRESLLGFLISLPLIIALAYRYLLPALEAQLLTRLDFDLTPYHPMLMAGFVGMSPALIGAVYGLLLVDERDQKTLAVLRVMPFPFYAFLAIRFIAPFFLSVIVTTAAYPIATLTPLPLGVVFILALSAATLLPVATLIVVFASNKLTGLVLFRLVSTVSAAPVFAFIAPASWERLAWIIPSYWPMKALWLAVDGTSFWPQLAVAPLMNIVLTIWLYRRFANTSER